MNTEEIKEWFENQNYLPVMLQKDWKDTILKENLYTEEMVIELLKEFSERSKNTKTSDKHETEQLNILGVSSSAYYEDEINITRCPKCNSSDHLMITGEPYKCMDCGNKWT